MNRHSIARFFVGSIAALFAAAVAVPARAQVAPPPYDRDGRYNAEMTAPPDDEYDDEAPAEGDEPDQQEYQAYDSAQADAYDPASEGARPEGYVVADGCADGCDATTWTAPYVEPSVGTTIVFGLPVFRLGHWYRPYFHRAHHSYYGSYRHYAPAYRTYGYGGWRGGSSSHRSNVAPRAYSGWRTDSYSAPRTYSAPRAHSGSRTGNWSHSGSGRHSSGGYGEQSRR